MVGHKLGEFTVPIEKKNGEMTIFVSHPLGEKEPECKGAASKVCPTEDNLRSPPCPERSVESRRLYKSSHQKTVRGEVECHRKIWQVFALRSTK